MIHRFSIAILLIVFIGGCSSADEETANWNVPDLMLGTPGLEQNILHQQLAEGVDLYDVERGGYSQDGFILSSGVLDDVLIAQYEEALGELSIQYSTSFPYELAPQGNSMGRIIRIDNFNDAQEAGVLAAELRQQGLNFNVRYSAQEGAPTTGPFKVSVLRIDLNQFQGRIINALANNQIVGAETVSSMSSRNNAFAGINAGYFVFNDSVGDYGAPAGIFVKDGQLIREAVDGRPVMIVDNSAEKTKITLGSSVTTEIYLLVGDRQIRLNGINRRPGFILNCGGFEAGPITVAAHDYLCGNESEIIVFDDAYGDATPLNANAELVISKEGAVVGVYDSGGREIQPENLYIQISGNKTLDVNVGDRVELIKKIDIDGKEFVLNPDVSMISAGPTLLVDGQRVSDLRIVQGWSPYPSTNATSESSMNTFENREAFYEGWVLRRNPRTAVGLTDKNILYFVVVYGRNPGVSEGATITEMELLMQALETESAMNLDGGGSSVMIVNGQATGPYSDPQERAVSDTLLLISNR